MNILDMIIDFENGTLSDPDGLRLFSELVKTRQAYSLQGFYGRSAEALIRDGYLKRSGELTQKALDFIEDNE